MLTFCQHIEDLKDLAFQYKPLETLNKVYQMRGLDLNRLDRCECLAAGRRIFEGPDQE
jgi:hypothetical protein